MKFINRLMTVVRILAVCLILFMGLDYFQDWGIIGRFTYLRLVIFGFAVIYLFGSIIQIMARFKNQQQ